MKLIGLDLETSGTDINTGAVPIQIGLAIEIDGSVYTTGEYIGGWDFKNGPATWDEESAEVHNIPQEMAVTADPAWKVDIRMANWLLPRIGPRMWNLPVGWNVNGFDMPFVRRWFPNLSRMLSYRAVDLTGIVIALAEENEGHYKAIKKEAKTEAAKALPDWGKDWHDAEFDAAAALAAYRWLTQTQLEIDSVETFEVTSFDMRAACRAYTHDYDMLNPENQKRVENIILKILEAGAGAGLGG